MKYNHVFMLKILLADAEHSVAEHVAERLVGAEAVVLRVRGGRHEDVVARREAEARQPQRRHAAVERHREAAAKLVVEEPQGLALQEKISQS